MSLGISNFLEEISSLSHSIVFLYFFALTTEEGYIYMYVYTWGFPSGASGKESNAGDAEM